MSHTLLSHTLSLHIAHIGYIMVLENSSNLAVLDVNCKPTSNKCTNHRITQHIQDTTKMEFYTAIANYGNYTLYGVDLSLCTAVGCEMLNVYRIQIFDNI